MSYKIHTKDATAAIAEILKQVKADKDKNNKKIGTWSVKIISKGEELLVHTTEQWEKKGCIELSSNDSNDIVFVKFYYWDSFKKEDRSGDEGKYYLGRFTELLLVHFEGLYSKIEIV